MRPLTFLISRNLVLFRKNGKNVILCFFSILIVFGLYAIFLRDFMIQSVNQSGLDLSVVHEFTDRMMLSGLLIVVNTATCFGIMQLSIHDYESGISRDFHITPVSRPQLMIGYWITSILVSFLYTCIALFGILCFWYAEYGAILSLQVILVAILLILVSSILNSELLLCLIAMIRDTTTFSTFGNLYGMMAGFLAGTYLPYDLYPKRLKQILFYYPPTHLTSLMRQLLVKGIKPQDRFPESKELWNQLFLVYGIRLTYQQQICSLTLHLLILAGSFAVMLFFLGIIYREK